MGRPSKYKARLIVKGNEQKEGLDFQESFAPMIKWNTIKTMIALTTHYDWKMSQMDIKIVFLDNDLKEEVYMSN